MSRCDECSIEEKLYQCCGRHPMTGEYKMLELKDGRKVKSCLHLDLHGNCTIYAERPGGCRDFFCHGFREQEWIRRG